jgi:hypothetical protein
LLHNEKVHFTGGLTINEFIPASAAGCQPGGCLVELLFWSIVGGIVGTVFMDIADKSMAWVNFTTGAA